MILQMEISHGLKRPGREAVRAPPSSAKTKNDWSCTTTPPNDLLHREILLCGFRHNQRRQKLRGMFLTPNILQVFRPESDPNISVWVTIYVAVIINTVAVMAAAADEGLIRQRIVKSIHCMQYALVTINVVSRYVVLVIS
jgi:hypothetical protein